MRYKNLKERLRWRKLTPDQRQKERLAKLNPAQRAALRVAANERARARRRAAGVPSRDHYVYPATAKERRLRIQERARKRRSDDRAFVFGKLGGRCVVCGFDDPRVLQLDHIHGDGHVYRNGKYNGSAGAIRTLMRKHGEPWLYENIQLLCTNHHRLKTSEERRRRR